MTISDNTISILKNFAKIHPSIVIPPGNVLKIRTNAVYAEATVPETFPIEVRIANIRDLLRIVNLFKQPDFEFTDDFIKIAESDGSARAVYPCAKAGSLVLLPMNRKQQPVPLEQAALSLNENQFTTVQKALGVGIHKHGYGCMPKYLRVSGSGESVDVSVVSGFRHQIEEFSIRTQAVPEQQDFSLVFSAEFVTMLPGGYEILLTRHYAQFTNTQIHGLSYFIGAEPQLSSWGGKQSYQVRVTRGSMQESLVNVQAHSPEQAEQDVRQMALDDLSWQPAARPYTEFKVLA